MQSLVNYWLFAVIIHSSYLMSNNLVDGLDFTKRHNDYTLIDIKKTTLCNYAGGPKALGMESGVIPDDDITASSSYNQQSVGPQNARLNREIASGAWCPSRQLTAPLSGTEWIQVNLHSLYVVTGIAIQGRFGNGVGVEYVEGFWIEYSRDNGTNWHKWTDHTGNHKLPGNIDTYTVVNHELSHPLVGVNLVRIVPFASHQRTTCLRLELYGCKQRFLPIAYSMPNGYDSDRFGDLVDMTYDGQHDFHRYLSGGIGQLIDGIKGDDNYKVNKGFEWIGWKSDGEPNSSIQIIFQFSKHENFTSASFHCHNIYSQDMEVFSSAKIWFSFDGKTWSKKPVEFSYMADNVIEKARDVVIHLHHRIGKFAKFELKFAKKWLLISEVSFKLSKLEHNFTESYHHLDYAEALTPITTAGIHSNRFFMSETIVLIAFGIVFTVIFIGSIVFIRFHMKRRDKTGHIGHEISHSIKDLATSPLYCEPKDFSPSRSSSFNDPEYAVPDVALTNPNLTQSNQNSTTLSISSTKSTPKHLIENPFITHQKYYASTDILKSPKTLSNNNFIKTNGSTFKYSSNGQNDGNVDLKCIPKINEEDIVLIRSPFGSSKFGELSIGKYQPRMRLQTNDQMDSESLVMVKALRNEKLKNEFYHEMKSKWFISAKSDRIAKIFGFISEPNFTAMVLEVGDCDLNHFLNNCDNKQISYQTLIYIASEVASGMKYLETLGFVHKDLAARNIVVYTQNLVIKIGDSGAYESSNQCDYVNGMAIRWASPESLIHGQFTTKSDVYSFGVLLWEVLTYCSMKPFHTVDDQSFLKAVVSIYEQIANNIECTYKDIYCHPFSDDNNHRILAQPRPDGCPEEIYDLMLDCWQTNDSSRPTFREISLFLNRKTLGFQKPIAI
ncbi:epithelial discoidin domain-containing receptor 1-like [Oppia nitens]|uniref:epithelial discoidin domain-containing receptor 1-like n=1 Tax=Oppia nitens TaxID=1686743 RepID=UPI0023D978CA|nr:epithelial discoidin domain-containing receptor 1-like [Oppia nitens]XP_054158123.1 epithelial discoidin domain-containing receptor 1-like [Oppia nitens]